MLTQKIENQLQAAAKKLLPDTDLSSLQVRPCNDPQHGDFQTTALMGIAKGLKKNPRALAEEVLRELDVSEWCETPTIGGPGFINFRLRPEVVAGEIGRCFGNEGLLVSKAAKPLTKIVDFSSPNIAKSMHVGHIRSTILGDCLTRVNQLLGHRVITDNHLGDWGTQFGFLLLGWKEDLDRDRLQARPMDELERLYQTYYAASKTDPEVRERAKKELVKLQAGDEENLCIWKEMIRLSMAHFNAIYKRLNASFDHILGESFYNPYLHGVVNELVEKSLATESEGALVIYFEGVPELKDKPTLIRKSDGGFNYATTDLATLDYRIKTWNPDEIIYVTDFRQQLHFKQVFEAFRRWQPEAKTNLTHVWFGSIMGANSKPLTTREGGAVKLDQLLNEAEERAYQVVTGKNPELPEETRREIGRVVGIGAVKFADLLPHRQSDYMFDWDKMLALTGTSAVYLLYAYARFQSIFRKAGDLPADVGFGMVLELPEEIQFAKILLNFGFILESVAAENRPNILCNYLLELAEQFSRFWKECPVLTSPEPNRSSRLVLLKVGRDVLKQGLTLLGLETVEQM